MAIDPLPSGRLDSFQLTRPVELTCVALCIAQAGLLAALFFEGDWLLDQAGQVVATDFVNVWAAGRTVLDGHPAAVVYDVALHKSAEEAALGHGFAGKLPWNYPPTFLLAAAALALLPYLVAQVIWVFSTFAAYVAVVRAIIGHRVGVLFACAYPGILPNVMAGQNGFLTAALLGGCLATMQRRPLVAGCLLGLLAFKPHLGILFPLVLIAGSFWRVIAAAVATVAVLVGASVLAFGVNAWEAFAGALPVVSQTTLSEGQGDFGKMQTMFTLVRWLGGTEGLAWAVQISLIVLIAVLLCLMWRSRICFELKAAGLATGALLATPYLFLYDLVVLAVPMAFLLRAGAQGGFLPGEMPALGIACLLIISFMVVKVPVGLAAILVVALIIARRVLVLHGSRPELGHDSNRKSALV
jgi:arabinofuranan 3-O-arabinosyltransferase